MKAKSVSAATAVDIAPSRVVALSSRGHHLSPVVFEDIQFERRPYHKWLAYGQSKTANVLFAADGGPKVADFGLARAAAPMLPGWVV